MGIPAVGGGNDTDNAVRQVRVFYKAAVVFSLTDLKPILLCNNECQGLAQWIVLAQPSLDRMALNIP